MPSEDQTLPRPTPQSLAKKYSRTVRTIERWEASGRLPPADRINGRKSWAPGTEPQFDPQPKRAAGNDPA